LRRWTRSPADRARAINFASALLARPPRPADDAYLLWYLLLEGAALVAGLPAIIGGRRCGVRDATGWHDADWPGLIVATAQACQGCHRSAELRAMLDHTDGCWLRVDGGSDPALVGTCRGCGVMVTAPRWASMASGIGCPRCEGGIELSAAGDADRWAEAVRLGGRPTEPEAAQLLGGLAGLVQLRPAAGPWTVAAHAAALTRARLRQLARRPRTVDQARRLETTR